jgi:hypothetical protein
MGKKEEYMEKMEAQLEQLNAQVNRFIARGKEAKADMKIEYYKAAEELEAKQKVAQARMDELEKSSADAWEELKYGMDSAFTELQTAFTRAAAKFR